MTTVHLKQRTGKKGISLYLKWYAGKNWHYDFLKMRLNGNKDTDKIKMRTVAQKEADKITMRKAEQARINKESELESGANGTIPGYMKKMPFVEYFKTIMQDTQNWKTVLHHLEKFPQGNVPMTGICERWGEAFKKYLDYMKANSANLIFGIFRAALKRAAKDKIISTDNTVFDVERKKSEETTIEHLEEFEIEKLAATECRDPEVKRAFLFGCLTGLRLSDVENLKWENIENGKLKYRQIKTGVFVEFELPKNAKELLHQGQQGNVVNMPSNLIFKLNYRNWTRRILREWVRKAGIRKNIHFHCSRHSFACILLDNNVDIYTVSRLMGHTKLRTTERYAKISDQKKKAAIKTLDSIKIKIG